MLESFKPGSFIRRTEQILIFAFKNVNPKPRVSPIEKSEEKNKLQKQSISPRRASPAVTVDLGKGLLNGGRCSPLVAVGKTINLAIYQAELLLFFVVGVAVSVHPHH